MKVRNVKDFYETFDFDRMINDKAPELIQEFLDGEIRFITKHIKPYSSILEIGCGYGRLLRILAKNSKNVIGIDFSKKMIESSRENLKNLKNVDVILMNADNLSFKDNSFDYVVCLDASFGNMPKIEQKSLNEMKRVCKKDGEIIISVFSENAKNTQIENYRRIGLKEIKDDGNAIHTSEGLYSRRFSEPELTELFKKARLECQIIKICPINYIVYGSKE